MKDSRQFSNDKQEFADFPMPFIDLLCFIFTRKCDPDLLNETLIVIIVSFHKR